MRLRPPTILERSTRVLKRNEAISVMKSTNEESKQQKAELRPSRKSKSTTRTAILRYSALRQQIFRPRLNSLLYHTVDGVNGLKGNPTNLSSGVHSMNFQNISIDR